MTPNYTNVQGYIIGEFEATQTPTSGPKLATPTPAPTPASTPAPQLCSCLVPYGKGAVQWPISYPRVTVTPPMNRGLPSAAASGASLRYDRAGRSDVGNAPCNRTEYVRTCRMQPLRRLTNLTDVRPVPAQVNVMQVPTRPVSGT